MNAVTRFASPLGRLLIAAIFVNSGINKIFGYAGTQSYMESQGVPGELLPLVILVEVVAGLAVVIGWQTRVAAFLLAGFTLLSALLFHLDFDNQMQTIQFMKNLAIAGGFLVLVAHGPGALSVDNRGAASQEAG